MSLNTYFAYSRKGGENGEQRARVPEPVRTKFVKEENKYEAETFGVRDGIGYGPVSDPGDSTGGGGGC